jgi:magnesium chelatase subunit H
MKRKPTSDVDAPGVRVVLVTLDNHLGAAAVRAAASIARDLPGIEMTMHAAADWAHNPAALSQCLADIREGDIIVVTMLFMEEHIQAVLPTLSERQPHCDAMVCCMSAAEVMRLTRMGRFSMDGEQSGPLALLKRLRGNRKGASKPAGAQQLSVLRQLPRILRFIPGTAQDLRAYFLVLQYWLASSEANLERMVRFLVDRYAAGPRADWQGSVKADMPIDYPELGVYHPRMSKRLSKRLEDLPKPGSQVTGTVGLLIMRSYVLAGNTAHYDATIAAMEARGLRVITAFASGLDARPAVQQFFVKEGAPTVDAVLSLTGFSLVGGPAYNDAHAAEEMLAALDVPYIAAQSVEFQSLAQWESSEQGLMPLETTMMVAIPELDGATGPIVFGGRGEAAEPGGTAGMLGHAERIDRLADRVQHLIQLRKSPRAGRKLAVVLFNFPPNAGNAGTAAHLSVFSSLFNTLKRLDSQGYSVEMPESVDDLRTRIIEGNAHQYGTDANVHSLIEVDDHVRREPWLTEIEAQWGPAPGKQLSNGRSIFVLGAQFGNVFVGLQPGFGHEGDPMRLLFSHDFAPTHAFSAFYRYIRDDFAADAVLHFGTHGALEFMPGKQTGMSAACWPDRLIGNVPNYYLYASNNPSEGMIAKRRAAATLVSYLTPPITRADLYRGLDELKASIDRWRTLTTDNREERKNLAELIRTQAEDLDLVKADHAWTDLDAAIETLRLELIELEETLIPYGLHVVGEPASREQRIDTVEALASASHGLALDRALIERLVDGVAVDQQMIETHHLSPEVAAACAELAETAKLLGRDHELDALLHALDGGFIRPAPGGDVIKNPQVLPTGRNLHGFDPFRLPSQFAIRDGMRQAQLLLQQHTDCGNELPSTVALVLWGTDNLKSEGGPIAQALALMGAEPRFDSYGRVAGANLTPLETLGRPRIDVVMTLSGIFRDLLPLQTKLLAEAAYLAATADEPESENFIRRNALAYQAKHGCDLETASLRVFSNAEGAYGSNVNMLIDNSRWDDEDELAETFSQRKSFAYSRSGKPSKQTALLDNMLSGVDLAYQNLDSVELGITTVDHYFDTLGGISRAAKRAGGRDIPVYISDQTNGDGRVRTLAEQVALETRTRMLNPKWYSGILEHGYEGVRQIETHVTNTMGWSATTGQVAPWIYERLSQTFILDEEMRERLAKLNPSASVKVAHRLLEACERNYWDPDDTTLDALRHAGEDLEDRLEGITKEAAA